MSITTQLRHLEQQLGLAVDADLAALRGQIETAPAQARAAAVEAYRAKLVELLGGQGAARDRLADVAVKGLRGKGLAFLADGAQPFVEQALAARRALDAALDVGPVTVDLGAVPASVAGGRLVALLPIESLHLEIDAGALHAAGSGYLRDREAGGLLTGDLGVAKVTVAAIVERQGELIAVLALLRAEFRPTGLQLGLGFSLDAVGGIVGVHRRADVDELRRRLVDGSATDALFGGSTSANGVRSTLATLAAVFPTGPGEVVVGPVLRLGWLNVGGSSLVRLDVGLILQLPEARVIVPGRAVLEVPGPGVPLVHLRADMLGVVDVPGKRLTIDAVLVDSHVLGVFKLGGTAAALLAWGDQPSAVLTIGGFYPGFDPAPAQIPPQRRISFGLESPLPGLSISAEGYVAAAAGTLQFGGSITAAYGIKIAQIRGSVFGDAILQLSPLHIDMSVGGQVMIEALGQDLLGVTCHGTLTGPGPLILTLTATARILWEDVGGTKRIPLSSSGGADLAPAEHIGEVVQHALDDPGNATPEAGGDPDVAPQRPPVPPARPLIPAFGAVVWRQDRFPLGAQVERADGRKLVAPATVTVTRPPDATDHREPLATAMFLDLTTAEMLAMEPYQRHHVGFRLPVKQDESNAVEETTSDYIEMRVPHIPTILIPLTGMAPTFAVSAAMLAAAGPPMLLAQAAPPVTAVADATWTTASDAGSFDGGGIDFDLAPAVALAKAHADAAVTAMPSVAFSGVGL